MRFELGRVFGREFSICSRASQKLSRLPGAALLRVDRGKADLLRRERRAALVQGRGVPTVVRFKRARRSGFERLRSRPRCAGVCVPELDRVL